MSRKFPCGYVTDAANKRLCSPSGAFSSFSCDQRLCVYRARLDEPSQSAGSDRTCVRKGIIKITIKSEHRRRRKPHSVDAHAPKVSKYNLRMICFNNSKVHAGRYSGRGGLCYYYKPCSWLKMWVTGIRTVTRARTCVMVTTNEPTTSDLLLSRVLLVPRRCRVCIRVLRRRR